MASCYCTGACREIGRCPNLAPQHFPINPYAERGSQEALTRQEVRCMIREEIARVRLNGELAHWEDDGGAWTRAQGLH